MSGHGHGHGFGLDKFSGEQLVIPTTGPDSFGDGRSLISWLDPDHMVTTSGSDLVTIVDRAALAQGKEWTANVAMDPATDQNGTNRWNCNEPDCFLERTVGQGFKCSKGFVAVFYARMFTTPGNARVPWGITNDPSESVSGRQFEKGAISINYTDGEIRMGDNSANTQLVTDAANMTNNTHYVLAVTYDRDTGDVFGYKNGVDFTHTTQVNLGTNQNFTWNYAWGVGVLNPGLWNCGHQMMYNAAPSFDLINAAGQYISDEYGLGQTWALS